MGQSAGGKYGRNDGKSYTEYGEKTSEHGHWEPGDSYAGTNANGQSWQNQRMNWVEAPAPAARPASRPAPSPASTPKSTPIPTELSEEAATAIGRSLAYENTVRKKYGDDLIAEDRSVMDNFKQDTIDYTEEASKPYFDSDDFAQKYKLAVANQLDSPSSRLNLVKAYT